MSENVQARSDQLVAAPTKPHEMDDMFTGLGLGSYVQKKDTGAIATGLMASSKGTPSMSAGSQKAAADGVGNEGNQNLSLEDKKRMMQQSEQMQRLSQQPQKLQPAYQVKKCPSYFLIAPKREVHFLLPRLLCTSM